MTASLGNPLLIADQFSPRSVDRNTSPLSVPAKTPPFDIANDQTSLFVNPFVRSSQLAPSFWETKIPSAVPATSIIVEPLKTCKVRTVVFINPLLIGFQSLPSFAET